MKDQKLNTRTGVTGKLATVTSIGVLLMMSFHVGFTEQAPGNQTCKQIDDDNRDARGYIDSCIGTPESTCENPTWCVIVGGLPNGWYCGACAQTECTCAGTIVYGNVQDGSCSWGPRNNGECFCKYDEQMDPVPVPFYDCSS